MSAIPPPAIPKSTARSEYERASRRARNDTKMCLAALATDHGGLKMLHGLRLAAGQRALVLDHLLIHAHGVVLLENRSEQAELSVSARGEWTQQFKGKALRIASPPRRLARKVQHLTELLARNAALLRDAPLDFSEIAVAKLVVVPDESAELGIAELCSQRALSARLANILGEQRRAARGPLGLRYVATRSLQQDEVFRLTAFLRTQHQAPDRDTPRAHVSNPPSPQPFKPQCEACSSANLYVKHQEGYTFMCFDCGHSTAISRQCRACRRRGYIRRDGNSYLLECEHCLSTRPLYERQLERVRWL